MQSLLAIEALLSEAGVVFERDEGSQCLVTEWDRKHRGSLTVVLRLECEGKLLMIEARGLAWVGSSPAALAFALGMVNDVNLRHAVSKGQIELRTGEVLVGAELALERQTALSKGRLLGAMRAVVDMSNSLEPLLDLVLGAMNPSAASADGPVPPPQAQSAAHQTTGGVANGATVTSAQPSDAPRFAHLGPWSNDEVAHGMDYLCDETGMSLLCLFGDPRKCERFNQRWVVRLEGKLFDATVLRDEYFSPSRRPRLVGFERAEEVLVDAMLLETAGQVCTKDALFAAFTRVAPSVISHLSSMGGTGSSMLQVCKSLVTRLETTGLLQRIVPSTRKPSSNPQWMLSTEGLARVTNVIRPRLERLSKEE